MQRIADFSQVVDAEVEQIARYLAQVFDAPAASDRIDETSTWSASIPEGTVHFLNAFRAKYFAYDLHIKILHEFFRKHGIRRVGDLGCGTASHLMRLAKLGYECVGVDESAESLAMAQEAAGESGVAMEFVHADLRKVSIEPKLDAIISMYVPLSPASQADALRNAKPLLAERGIFAQVQGQIMKDAPMTDELYNIDVADLDRYKVTRFEHWWIENEIISWNAFYLASEYDEGKNYPRSVYAFLDHNDMHFIRYERAHERKRVVAEIGYQLVSNVPTLGTKSAPPWVQESLEFLQKVK